MEEVGVPVGCVGRLPRKSEFNTIDEYSSAIVKSLEEFSKSNYKPFQKPGFREISSRENDQ